MGRNSMSQWHMNRLGLVDFWCYENEEFSFQNGHMLLRGSNGSGKSVTMQSFIPLLLDGNRSSERLDPFGTRSRKMETYLIDENSDRDERIGYLYLEFKRQETDLYMTIGMGLRARKNKSLDVWYFVIEDNRRVNIDFSLIEHHLTLTKKQLENILGSQVINSQGEYMRKVNDVLFGFSQIDDYKDAIDLLLQLRSPKLSNSLSPAKINEILAKSLQPLSEDDLRPMSEAITNMDNLQDELENLKTSLKAAQKISQSYDIYNRAILLDKWNKYHREDERLKTIQKEIGHQHEELKNIQMHYQDIQKELSQNQIKLEVIVQEKQTLLNPQMEKIHQESLEMKERVQTLSLQIKQKKEQVEIKEHKYIDLKNDIEKYENRRDHAQQQANEEVKCLDAIYETFPFSEHIAFKETWKHDNDFEWSYTKQRLKEENKQVEALFTLYHQYDRYLEQISDLEEQIIQHDDQLSLIHQQENEAKKKYQDMIQDYQEYFHHYHDQNQILKLSLDDLTQMKQFLIDYEIHHDYGQIYEIVHQRYIHLYEHMTKNKGTIQFELYQLKKQYEDIFIEYHSWLEKKDFEPQRDILSIKQRQYLKQQDIDHIPLYQLLDFEESLSQDERNTIEELLSQLKLLDALLVEQQYRAAIESLQQQGHDYYLWTQFPLKTLQSIKIHWPFDQQQLQHILKQLGISKELSIDITENSFSIGSLYGTLDHGQESQLIGYERRQLLRQRMIDQLTQKKNDLNQRIQSQEEHIQKIDAQIQTLKYEMESFRNGDTLKDSYQAMEYLQKEATLIEKRMDQLLDSKQQLTQKNQMIFQDIRQESEKILVEPSYEALKYRKEDIESYANHLETFKEFFVQKQQNQKLLEIETDKMNDLTEDLDQLRYDVDQLQHQEEVCEGRLVVLEQELQQAGYQQQHQKLEQIEQEIKRLETIIRENDTTLGKLEAQQHYCQESLNSMNDQHEQQNQLRTIYDEIFKQELQYGLVVENKEQFEQIVRQLSSSKMNKSVSEYLAHLQSVFFEQASYLSQYHLMHEIAPLCHQVDDVDSHFMIKANHQGRKIPFYQLIQILQERIETQKLLIVDEDRHIFEEILVNTIGRKIRMRIQSSQRWVEKMERYMHDMNTSSGLQLGLKWRSKKALDEDELDTQELVSLLEKDYRILKESDRQKISQHFRFKIESARRLSLDDNTTASFYQLIKDVMDYRQWFEFTLYAKKPHENRKELTNRVFYSYSGGEKALVMYVPLFSAVAAKFESARDDAPHLIALDEAFAGVDENNIDNLFALIEKFGFDYIMNSQFLWGDYPSCRSLAIYELFRPNNAPFVTKVAYLWNGHKRKMIV